MRLGDALRLTGIRDVLETETARLQRAAEEQEEASISGTAKARYHSIGKAIMDDPNTIQKPIEGAPGSLEYVRTVNLVTGGLSVIFKAKAIYTEGSLRGREIKTVEAAWTKNTYAADAPLAVQRVEDIDTAYDIPETLGTLRLLEQSLETAGIEVQPVEPRVVTMGQLGSI